MSTIGWENFFTIGSRLEPVVLPIPCFALRPKKKAPQTRPARAELRRSQIGFLEVEADLSGHRTRSHVVSSAEG